MSQFQPGLYYARTHARTHARTLTLTLTLPHRAQKTLLSVISPVSRWANDYADWPLDSETSMARGPTPTELDWKIWALKPPIRVPQLTSPANKPTTEFASPHPPLWCCAKMSNLTHKDAHHLCWETHGLAIMVRLLCLVLFITAHWLFAGSC